MFTYLHAMAAIVTGKLDIKSEKGATAVEYGLMVGLIAIVIIAAVTLIGTNLNQVFTTVQTKLAAVPK